jgi:hypothetical protein
MYDAFSAGAAAASIPFEVVHRKINVSNPITQWPHEQFARKQVLSGTLSAHPTPAPLFARSSLWDRRNAVSTQRLAKHIALIAEVLARRMYPAAAAGANATASAAAPRQIIANTQVCACAVMWGVRAEMAGARHV